MTSIHQSKSAIDLGFPSPTYAGYILFVLVVAVTLSYLDRTVLTLMVDPIREALQITDVQFSLLHGLAFAIFYTFFGIPIGRLADRTHRGRIIAVGCFIWSGMTVACGLAASFPQMFLARVGVGVGEATLSPSAYSLLTDAFPPKKLVHAMSVYSAAAYMGAGVALILGGAAIAAVPAMDLPYVGHMESWRVVFILVGLPGVVVVLMLLSLREPSRKGMLRGTIVGQSMPLRECIGYIVARRGAYGFLTCGIATKSILYTGTIAWVPTYFIRTHDWTAPTVGLWYGLALLVFGSVGVMSGSAVSAWLRDRGRIESNVWVGMIAAGASVAPGVVAPLMPNPWVSLALFSGFIYFSCCPVGAAAAAMQEITPNQMRAQISALYIFTVNLVGLFVGPALIAIFTEKVFQDPEALKYSIAIVIGIAGPITSFLLWRALRPYRQAKIEFTRVADVPVETRSLAIGDSQRQG